MLVCELDADTDPSVLEVYPLEPIEDEGRTVELEPAACKDEEIRCESKELELKLVPT